MINGEEDNDRNVNTSAEIWNRTRGEGQINCEINWGGSRQSEWSRCSTHSFITITQRLLVFLLSAYLDWLKLDPSFSTILYNETSNGNYYHPPSGNEPTKTNEPQCTWFELLNWQVTTLRSKVFPITPVCESECDWASNNYNNNNYYYYSRNAQWKKRNKPIELTDSRFDGLGMTESVWESVPLCCGDSQPIMRSNGSHFGTRVCVCAVVCAIDVNMLSSIALLVCRCVMV